MTPKELHDYVVLPLKEHFNERFEVVGQQLSTQDKRITANTNFRWKLIGMAGAASLFATAIATKLLGG